MVIYYGVRPAWMFKFVRRIARTPYMGMPNILAGSELCRELAWAMTSKNDAYAAKRLKEAAVILLQDPLRLDALRLSLMNLTGTLLPQNRKPREAAAQAILRVCSIQES